VSHLTVEQRYTISVMTEQGYTQASIALALGKCKSVVSRELSRNCDQRSGAYDSDLAQRKHDQRQKEKYRHRPFNDDVRRYVEKLLEDDLSPEQIAGRSKLAGIPCPSHERIYQHVWQDKKEGGFLYQHLRHQGRNYRKRGNTNDTRGLIKDRVGIENRPEIVEEKMRFGDLEIDTIIGKNHQGAILTITDRRSNLLLMRKLDGKEAAPVVLKTIEALQPIMNLIHTITADNGKEFAYHKEISKALEIDFYFARPYHSWERGGNENTNGLVRQYFKKGTSFEDITDEDIERVQNQLNSRPRKKLSYLTPNEYFLSIFTKPKVALAT
jgi:IS30 family transposase